ncbi:MAG TPA: hypothetical protein VGJ02_00545 [Pyrinomonadaceae bacterium]
MNHQNSSAVKKGKREEGAALVMALLVTFLLLIASAGLLLETTTNTMNVTDATAQQQAFDAAESGIQAAINVLRDNVTLPNARLIVANPIGCATASTQPEACKENRINYLKALDPVYSNLTTTGPDASQRLSRWLSYDSTRTDRVLLGTSGNAYKLEISDPDHTGAIVTYSTQGKFGDNDGSALTSQKTWGDTTNGIKINYTPQASIQINTTDGGSRNFGTLTITKYGNGAQTSANRFEFEVTMTQPYWGIRVIRGYIMPNTCSAGVCNTPNVRFDSQTFTLQGSQIALLSTGGNAVSGTYISTAPEGFDSVLTAPASGSSADSVILGSMSSPEPRRLELKSTGYGPRGSTKQIEVIVRKNFFDGLSAPATLTLVGPPSDSLGGTFTFNPGSSAAMEYSGQDQVSTDIIPPIGTTDTSGSNLDSLLNTIDNSTPPFNGTITGTPSDVSTDTPPWLSTPANLDTAVKSLQQVADGAGRYFPSGTAPTGTFPFGNPNGSGITFCDGDCVFTGNGGGILVVTGKLTLRGNFSFRGIIIVTGQNGVDRSGGGTGLIQGNMIIAPYQNSSVLPGSDPVGTSFLAPKYDLSGGGNSTIAYNSTAINNGLVAVSNFVLGVMEK